MNSFRDPLDKLISETLQDIHGRALNDGLANSFHSLDNAAVGKNIVALEKTTKRYQTNSLFAVAASIILIVGLAIPVLISSQNGSNSDDPQQIQSATEITATSTTIPGSENKQSPTTNPDSTDPGSEPTAPLKKSITSNTSPFKPPFNPPTASTTPTNPATINQLVRVSYSNTRANDVPLDGATISGNVYIFISNPDVFSASYFLDDGGRFEKGTEFRSGKTLPIDFNFRQSDGLTPKPFDTSTWSVGEHQLGIQNRSISTGEYNRTTIKFYVTR